MFWGISLEVGKRYSQTVEKSFHISMAALTGSNEGKGPVTVMVEVDKACYPICTLRPGKIPQQALDYIFTEGEEVLFYTKGDLDVHLTGYLIDEPSPLEYSTDEDDTASESNAASSEGEQNDGKKRTKKTDEESSEEETLHTLISELDELNEDNHNSVDIWLERSSRKRQRSENVEDDSVAPVSSLTGKLIDNENSEESEDNDWTPGAKRKLKRKQKAGRKKEKKTKNNLETDGPGKKTETDDSDLNNSQNKLNTSKSKQKKYKKNSS